MGRRYRIPLTKWQKTKLICGFAGVVSIVLVVIGSIHLQSILGDMAVTRVSNTVNRLVVASVSEAIESGNIQYEKLIRFEKSDSGAITALRSNMAEFNRLQAEIASDILQRLGSISETELTIPLGTLSGSPLLAGRGPRIRVKMQSYGSCTAHFDNKFDHAGINQTTHSIVLYVDVSMSILLPGLRTGTKVSNAFSVAETVIVGAVPDSYTYFDSGNSIVDEAHEYAINNG